MLSVTNKYWSEAKVNKNLIEKYSLDYDLSETISKILIYNKYSEEDMANFIKKKLVFYDHFSDKNKNRFENVNKLVKVNEVDLPYYLVQNYGKYKSLVD